MNRSRLLLATIFACLLVGASGCQKPPQIVGNEEAVDVSDQLWTAVTAKRLDLLEQTDARLRQLHDDKRLSDPAFQTLEEVVAKARENQWEVAAKNLKWFLKGQRG